MPRKKGKGKESDRVLTQTSNRSTRPPATDIQEVINWLTEKHGGSDSYNFAVVLPDEPGEAEAEANDGEEVKGKVIGCLGSITYPEIGYIFHPAYCGKGYATEAVQAFLPKLFEKMPSASADLAAAGQGWDYALARVDVDNERSIKLLERCGWTRGEITEAGYTSAMLGLRDSVSYKIARPGMKLEDVLEAIRQWEEGTPPVPDLM